MNTNKLARHYSTLTAPERLSLMLAAATRGDDAEHTRLVDSAPRLTFRVPHTHGRAHAFMVVGAQSHMDRLNLAALFFKCSALASEAEGDLEPRLWGVVRIYAYLMLAHAEGWKQFCDRERLDPTFCAEAMPGGSVLEKAEAEAGALAFTAEEVREYARRDGRPFESLTTAESVADELHAIYTLWAKHWE